MLRLARLALALSVLPLAPSAVLAQSDDAEVSDSDEAQEAQGRSLFTDGRRAFDDERYAEALEYFEAAYELSNHPELLYNIGLSAERAGEPERAREAFEAYLRESPDAQNAAEVRARLNILRDQSPEVEPVEVSADEGGSSPWLWVGIGAGALVVVGVVLVIVLVATSGSTVQEPLAGDIGPGGVVFALDGGRP